MKVINARVMEYGQPMSAYYMGTHVSGLKHYMEIRYRGFQTRKWVPAGKVTIDPEVKLRYCERVAELNG